MKKSTSIRISEKAKSLIESMHLEYGLSRSALIELAIRMLAQTLSMFRNMGIMKDAIKQMIEDSKKEGLKKVGGLIK